MQSTRTLTTVPQRLQKICRRQMTTLESVTNAKSEEDISSVFASLSGEKASSLGEKYRHIKRHLIQGNEEQVSQSWRRLLRQLREANQEVRRLGPKIVPQIAFEDLQAAPSGAIDAIKQRGVAVIRGVIPEGQARQYKEGVESYIQANPSTKAFPKHDPQVYELYWSGPQMAARSHPNLLAAQRFLMGLWHSKASDAAMSISRPMTYADRLRIRQPGDAGFALGPHVDGGSVERWEPSGYGRGKVYDSIWQGRWEEFDPWEASCRLSVVSDLYEGAGACSMFRMFQGWLSMSKTGPHEGTLMVNPLLQLSTAYFLLRPFFEPTSPPSSSDYLHEDNWRLTSASTMTSDLQGASPGHAQELNETLHPHLELDHTMVHVPDIRPGDYVAWHCDTIHAVDRVHQGRSDSSVMYIPVCPSTDANAAYLQRQRRTFLQGVPGPDFPGGNGESNHYGRPTESDIRKSTTSDFLQSMGFERLAPLEWEKGSGAKAVLARANVVLGM